MNKTTLRAGIRLLCLFSICLAALNGEVSGQQDEFNYFYRIYFKDKGSYSPSDYTPASLLSERSVKRREKTGIPVPDIKDIPVCKEYIEQIKTAGLILHCTSKWLNTALFKSKQSFDISGILKMPFVAEVRTVKRPPAKGEYTDKSDPAADQAVTTSFDRPVSMLNGLTIQSSGFDGKGILIAVLDAGFLKADIISSLAGLRGRKGIVATRDIIGRTSNVYDFHYHGTAVLSVLAGKIPGIIQGTAPGADFLLLRTEDDGSEFPVEEDYWAAGAEYADSAGADIISSSLGYYNFDDPSMNYSFSSMDGNKAFVTRAADIAASKGIIVLASAGNERNKAWKRIIAPSDGDSVICVGAVDENNIIASFSSAGPSSDRRIKPDVVTMGVNVTVQIEAGVTTKMSGTSFSCPVLSGMTACLMQAVPEAVNSEITDAIHYAGDRFSVPDSLYGYGIPDMLKALTFLQDLLLTKPEDPFIAFPNPTHGTMEIVFRDQPERVLIEIYNSAGIAIFRNEFREFAGRQMPIDVLENKRQGLYILRITTSKGTFSRKIIKTGA